MHVHRENQGSGEKEKWYLKEKMILREAGSSLYSCLAFRSKDSKSDGCHNAKFRRAEERSWKRLAGKPVFLCEGGSKDLDGGLPGGLPGGLGEEESRAAEAPPWLTTSSDSPAGSETNSVLAPICKAL